MEIVYFLLPASLFLVACGLLAYVWAVRSGQFDDLETPRWRVLSDDIARKIIDSKDEEERKGHG